MRQRRLPRGLSLIEIIVYIAIVSMLLAAVSVYAVGVHRDSQRRTAWLDTRTALDALEMYRGTHGRYPPEHEGFSALVKAKLLKQAPKDPWGHPLVYALRDGEPVVISLGADGAPGGDEDNADLSSLDAALE